MENDAMALNMWYKLYRTCSLNSTTMSDLKSSMILRSWSGPNFEDQTIKGIKTPKYGPKHHYLKDPQNEM